MRITTKDIIFENPACDLRVIYPSAPRGRWPGNKETIRVWQKLSNGTYKLCSKDEVIALEAALGEVDTSTIKFIEHKTLGKVCTAQDRNEANARLIAAASELLVELEADEDASQLSFTEFFEKHGYNVTERGERRRAAIAKAKGDESPCN